MSTQVTRSLKEINAEVYKLDGNIKSVTNQNKKLDQSLRLDPSSTVLLTQRTENLKKQMELATQKVQSLRDAQAQLKLQVQGGLATEEAYKKVTVQVAMAEAQVKSFAAQVQRANTQKLTNLQSSLRGVGRAATVAIAAVAALGYKYAETGDKIDVASARYRISAEDFQRGAFAFDRVTGNPDAYAAALENVQKQMSAVAKGSSRAIVAFEQLGISVDTLSGKSTGEVLDLITEKLRGIADEDEQLTMANMLLTSAGYEVAQMARATADELAALNELAEKNGILTQEEAAAAAALQDKLEDTQLRIQEVIMDLGGALIPLLETLLQIALVLVPILSAVASVFGWMPKPMQAIIAALLILLAALPKLIGIIKAVNIAMTALGANPINLKLLLICTVVALLIGLLIKLASYLGSIFGKKYTLDVDTSSLGVDIAGMTAQATQPAAVAGGGSTTTTYYDYSTTNVEAHTDADINEIAEQLSTKIKVGGK